MTPTRRLALPLAGALALMAVACAAARPAPAASGQEGPTLVVLLTVDQLRGDMLDHYGDAFTGGFRRLRDEGHRFTSASHHHAVTETAAGHATLATGVPPSRHGIVGNDFRVPSGGALATVYSVEDTASPVLGLPAFVGRSPARLERSGLADWILAADPRARVVSASKKDRSAITVGGRSPEAHVYWIADGTGRFVTSRYYEDRYPAWVERFNASVMPELWADSVWESTVPPALARLAGPDSVPWEADGVHTTFPHRASEEAGEGAWGHATWVDRTPIPDEAVLRFGLEALDALELGRRGATDLLALSFSQTDYVGHDYGPISREQMDNLARLDRHLATLFDALDRRVGEGRWVAALAADHGAMTPPEQTAEGGEPGHRLTQGDLQGLAAAVNEAVREGGADAEVRERIVERLEALPRVARVYRTDSGAGDAASDSFAALFRHSTFPDRFAGLLSHLGFELRWEEGMLGSVRERGTSHGSPYWHDRWVPLAFLGAGVEPGVSGEAAYTWDVAPTLAALGGVPAPADLEGRLLLR
ncbi:MAG: alkaline phosphatase family protein [Gemmatimonadetes bacterium]|nr:alkaline phosphatase family protein [Gemmatimonadota bacterium]